jgi:uncharacterized protein YdhG (YjbR/CyaY superfamily)
MSTTDPIADYIAEFPAPIQERLVAMRSTIREHAPQATERISYRIPTFHQGGNLVHFAAFAHHIGFYPGSSGIAAFADALAPYRQAKGSVQFPHDAPLPLDLVAAIVAFRVQENGQKHAQKHASKRAPRRAPKS